MQAKHDSEVNPYWGGKNTSSKRRTIVDESEEDMIGEKEKGVKFEFKTMECSL